MSGSSIARLTVYSEIVEMPLTLKPLMATRTFHLLAMSSRPSILRAAVGGLPSFLAVGGRSSFLLEDHDHTSMNEIYDALDAKTLLRYLSQPVPGL